MKQFSWICLTSFSTKTKCKKNILRFRTRQNALRIYVHNQCISSWILRFIKLHLLWRKSYQSLYQSGIIKFLRFIIFYLIFSSCQIFISLIFCLRRYRLQNIPSKINTLMLNVIFYFPFSFVFIETENPIQCSSEIQ